MEKIVKEKFWSGQPLNSYYLCTTFPTQTNWPRATPTSCPPILPSYSSRSAATRKKKIQRGGSSISNCVLCARCREQQDWQHGDLYDLQSQLDCPSAPQSLYLSDKVEMNNIGATGCSYLSQTDMRGLKVIHLGTLAEKQVTTGWGTLAASF